MAMLVEIDWVCELCFRTVTGDVLPEEWELVYQSAICICPACMERVKESGTGLLNMPGGCYAFGATDPRGHKFKLPKPISWVHISGYITRRY